MNSTPAPGSRTAAATDARHRYAQDALGRVRGAIKQIKREKAQPSVSAVARRAGVSRSFIYDNPDARAAVSAALAEAGERRVQLMTEADDQRESTWRERALNAEELKMVQKSRGVRTDGSIDTVTTSQGCFRYSISELIWRREGRLRGCFLLPKPELLIRACTGGGFQKLSSRSGRCAGSVCGDAAKGL